MIPEVNNDTYIVQVADENHLQLAETICREMEESAKARGTGIAKRSPLYLMEKMLEGKAIVATTNTGEWVGFCYIETWQHGKFVANSGLIVHPEHRKSGIATRIKDEAFKLSRRKYPDAKIIGLTTSLAVMKINSDLGYEPVTFSELPADDAFWKGCSSCVNYDILTRTNRKHCLCTGMLYDPEQHKKSEEKNEKWNFLKESKLYERWMRIKQRILMRFQDRPRVRKPERELETVG
ncbi:GNAT family N-acetyltransferase [Larkinella terrae]|uniref:GNAT family N-acetyltransferase n=1 Tax=Larkinella terrae TaxID=2025311 RepID=A0A7K0EDP0_9BACT|nr:GNAT family N-acetyltransferase [Larkinella terrae]MRS59967.1 GNAT family N-acetyltransferase [Larkinella terrae]